MSARHEFTKQTKLAAFNRAAGRCEGCGHWLKYGTMEYDHVLPCAMGGTNELDNCAVLCGPCHRVKTGKGDVPRIAKSNRQREQAAGIKKRRTIRAWRRFDGTPVYADD